MRDERARREPDAEAYLERIGIGRAQRPSPDFLDELIRAHQRHVPFENIDVFELHRNPSLDVRDLFDKIVVRKRGGYCFELNGLFFWLMQTLGFDARAVMARVTLRGTEGALISHQAAIVRFGATDSLADVGFGGPMPDFALPLADGASRTEAGKTFAVRKLEGPWWDIGYAGSSGEPRSVLRPCDVPVEQQDFAVLSFYQSQSEQSPFRLNRMANIKTETGAYDLRNSTFTEFRGGERIVTELADAESLERVLREKFGIVREDREGL